MEAPQQGKKICKSCQTEISAKAKKCPNCKADQRNWFIKHKILSAVLAVIVIAVIASASGGSKNASTTSKSSGTSKSTSAPLAKIGEAANDGKFQFVVNKMACGETSLNDGFGNVEASAQGQFCRVNISVKNIGTQSQSLDEASQYLYDAGGNKYSLDTSATIWAESGSQSPWGNDINPGNTLTSDIMFDVPKGTTPVTGEFHDSAFSGGVKVSLQ